MGGSEVFFVPPNYAVTTRISPFFHKVGHKKGGDEGERVLEKMCCSGSLNGVGFLPLNCINIEELRSIAEVVGKIHNLKLSEMYNN